MGRRMCLEEMFIYKFPLSKKKKLIYLTYILYTVYSLYVTVLWKFDITAIFRKVSHEFFIIFAQRKQFKTECWQSESV